MMTYVTYIAVFAAIIIIFIILYKIFRFIVSLLLIVVFAAIAYFTNPTLEKHRLAVTEKAKKLDSPMRKKSVSRESYYLFSLTAIDQGDDHRIVGVGAFTKVFIFGKP